jgi:4-amino-4-deoxychorismate lyase
MSHSGNNLLFESIQIRDGVPQRLDLHQARMDRARKHHFANGRSIELASLIIVPNGLRGGLVKCRVTYGENIGNIEFQPYSIREYAGVKIVEDDSIHYEYKFADRSTFVALEGSAPGHVVIIAQDQQLTDATYANIALYDGSRWITPSRVLLNGVMRQWLLVEGIVRDAKITLDDLSKYTALKLINAMLEWDESPVIPLQGVRLP